MLRYTPISALNKFNLDLVMARIKALLPVSPPYFEKDALTDKSERFFVSETIREKYSNTTKRKFHIL